MVGESAVVLMMQGLKEEDVVGGGGSKPFHCHQRPSVLSLWSIVVQYYVCLKKILQIWWNMLLARSRLMLVTVPKGVLHNKRAALISASKCAQHKMECASMGYGVLCESLEC